MIAVGIGLLALLTIQVALGVTLILNLRVSSRVYLAMIMLYMLSAGFTLGAIMA